MATCQDYQDLGFTKSGIYKLAKANGELFEVYCDLEDDGGGWIVFVRYDGTGNEMFDQDWATYRDGFGDLNSNFWWGNEFLYLISNNKPQELKVDLVKSTATAYGKYQQFKVSLCCCFVVDVVVVIAVAVVFVVVIAAAVVIHIAAAVVVAVTLLLFLLLLLLSLLLLLFLLLLFLLLLLLLLLLFISLRHLLLLLRCCYSCCCCCCCRCCYCFCCCCFC